MRRYVGLALTIMAAAVSPSTAEGPARLLKDINQVPSWERGSSPDAFTRLGSLLLFRASTNGTGFELWRTDGTADGTRLVKDLRPGPYSGLDWPSSIGVPAGFVEANGVLLFPADDGVHGLELWRTDGTAQGTFMLADIHPGAEGGLFTRDGPDPRTLMWVHAVSGKAMYFLADDGVHGFELWRTDGTSEGTLLLQDIQPGTGSAFGSYHWYGLDGATVGSTFYFGASNDASGRELWRTDGTSAGTGMVADLRPGPDSGAGGALTALEDGLLFFSPSPYGFGSDLWWTDGTAEGTFPLVGTFYFGPERVIRVGDVVYFQVSQYLYRTDGTYTGTFLLHEFHGGSMTFEGDLHGLLLMQADDGVHGWEPWVSDGTPEGTVLLKDIRPGSTWAPLQSVVWVGGDAYFLADDGVHGLEVWRSDGTPEGTRFVADVNPGPEGIPWWSAVPWQGGVLFRTTDGLYRIDAGGELTRLSSLPGWGELTVLGDRAFFASEDDVHGNEPWSSDGTPEGTGILRDVEPLPRNEGSNPSFIGSMTSPDGKPRALYAAWGGTARGLWVTDGTPRGTELLRDDLRLFEYNQRGPTLGGRVYFPADDGIHGWELWRSDGTREGTAMVVDLLPGEWGAIVSHLIAYRDRVYFLAEDLEHGVELWSSDGTAEGTHLVRDIEPGPDWSSISDLIVAGDTLFFTKIGSHGRELWGTDGTEAGTQLVKEIVQNFSGNCCSGMTPFAGRLLMQANDGVHGTEPWISDGTEEGTFLLKDIDPGAASSYYVEAVVAGTSAFFSTTDGISGDELWKTDGTETGTRLVADILPGPASSFPNFLGPVGDRVAFMVRSGAGDVQTLWRSDGSEAGTGPIAEGFPGYLWAAAAFDLGILFSERDEAHGLELWRTDGTREGTAFVQDVAPGIDWSNPRDFVQLGTRILFVADDLVASHELFYGRAALLLGRPDQAMRDLRAELGALGLPKGLEKSLVAKLDVAGAALAAGHPDRAVNALESFARHVEGRIGADQGADLALFARDLMELLEAR